MNKAKLPTPVEKQQKTCTYQADFFFDLHLFILYNKDKR